MYRPGYKRGQGNRFEALVLDMMPGVFLAFFTLFTFNRMGGWVFTLIAYMVSTTLPSIHITRALRRSLGMDSGEVLVVNFIIGNGLLNILYVFLTMVLQEVPRLVLMGSLTCVSLITGALTYWLAFRDMSRSEDSIVLSYIGVLIGAFPGVYTILKSLPNEYWRGDDPWGLAVVAKGIHQFGFSPAEAFEYFKGYFPLFTSGFYFHVASIANLTGAPVEFLVRYGGLVIAGTLTALTYIIVKRVTNQAGGVIGAFSLFLNQGMILRFSSPLREYYGYVILVLMLYLAYLRSKKENGFDPVYVVVQSALFGVTLTNHSLTPILILGVLGLDMMNSIVKKKMLHVVEIMVAIVASLVIGGPYYPFLYTPILEFFGVGVSTMIFAGIGGIVLFFGVLYLIKDRIKEESFSVSVPVKLVLLVLMMALFTLNLYYPPDLGEGFNYGYMKPRDFSPTFTILAVIGFISMAFYETPIQIWALALEVVFFVGLSYLGIGVPLSRLELYGVWVMGFSSAQLIGTLANRIRFKPISDSETNLTGIKWYVWKHRYTVLLLLLITLPYVSEISTIRQSPYTYNSDDVKSTIQFAETVRPEDLVVPHFQHSHIVYYADIPHESQINIDDPWGWKLEFYNCSDVYEMSDLVLDTFPEKERVHFYTMNDEYRSDKPGTLSREILEDYGYEVERGETRTYTFELPFTLDSLPLENVRYIGNSGEQVLESDYETISNILNDSNGYMLYYSTIEDELGYATSDDGIEWTDNGIIAEGFKDPYVVKTSSYHMYALADDNSLVHTQSTDGVTWEKPSVIVEAPNGYGFWEIESPVVWVNGTEWNMLYTLTLVNSTDVFTRLIHSKSLDGIQWSAGSEFKPILVDKIDHHQEYERILLTDVIQYERGLILLGRFKAMKMYGTMEWKTGSLWFYEEIEERTACLRSFTYTDNPEETRNVQSIQYSTSLEGDRLYYYLLDGVHVGYVDDNIGLEKELIVEP